MTAFLGQCACGCKLTQKLKKIGGDPNCEHDFQPIKVQLTLSTKEYHHKKRVQDILKKTKMNTKKYIQEQQELDENFKAFTTSVENEINEMIDVFEQRKKEMLELGEKQYNSKKELYESQIKSLSEFKIGCEECLKEMSKIFDENTEETPEREEEICQISHNFENKYQLPQIYHLSNTLQYIIQDENKETLTNDILKYGDIPQNEDPKPNLRYRMQKLNITSINQTLSHDNMEDDYNSKSTTSSTDHIRDSFTGIHRMNDIDITTNIIEEESDTKIDNQNLNSNDILKEDKREKSPQPSETPSTPSLSQNQALTLIVYKWGDDKKTKKKVLIKDLNVGWEGIKKLIKSKCKYNKKNDFNLVVTKGPDKETRLQEMQNLLDLQNLEKNYLRIEPINE